ncbi:MAG: twin-arginine translocase subunit TatB [Deltaproteobacteria bacterium]|nr:twin-arginine translocase subunit TatB [Deltaproteobacteria bacterium]
MFGIGMPELLLILAVALVVLGPKKLPELARSLGRGLAELKKATSDLKKDIDLGEDLKQVQQDFQEVKSGLQDIADTTLKEAPPPEYLEEAVSQEPEPPEIQPLSLEASFGMSGTEGPTFSAFPDPSPVDLHGGVDDIRLELEDAADRTCREFNPPFPEMTETPKTADV